MIKHRCQQCHKRHRFSKYWKEYRGQETRRCRKCGSIKFYQIKNDEPVCLCPGWLFPHRQGSHGCVLYEL